jgi:hypothetical protein
MVSPPEHHRPRSQHRQRRCDEGPLGDGGDRAWKICLRVPPDISQLSDCKPLFYPNGLLDSTENGLHRRKTRPVPRSNRSICPLTPPGQQLQPVSAQHPPWAPLEPPTFHPVTSVIHPAPTVAALRTAGCGRGLPRTTHTGPQLRPSGRPHSPSGSQPSLLA